MTPYCYTGVGCSYLFISNISVGGLEKELIKDVVKVEKAIVKDVVSRFIPYLVV